MSDQGELGRHWAAPSDDTVNHDKSDRPTSPISQVGEALPAAEPEAGPAVASGWMAFPEMEVPVPEGRTEFSAPDYSFDEVETNGRTEFTPPEGRLDFSVADPSAPEIEVPAPDHGAPALPPAADFGTSAWGVPDYADPAPSFEVPEVVLPDFDTVEPPPAAPRLDPAPPAAREPGDFRIAAAGPPAPPTPPASGGGAWEGSLFDGDSGEGVPGYAPVMPSGPSTPPKPGTPSSGNWRMPDWMSDEESADEMLSGGRRGKGEREKKEKPAKAPKPPKAAKPARPEMLEPSGPVDRPVAGAPVAAADGGGSKAMLYGGVGLLAVAVLAAGGVFLLKPGDSDPIPSANNVGVPKTKKPTAPTASLPPDKPLPRFPGKASTAVGQVNDTHSGLSYPRFGAPWVIPTKKNKLGVSGWSGQQIVVTEKLAGQVWYGQLLTGTLSVADRDAYQGPGTEKNAAALVTQGLLSRYYGFPHKTRPLASQALDVDGRKGWLLGTALTYKRAGVRATGEIMLVGVVDTGRKSPGIIFLTMPNTHRKLWPDLNAFIGQLKVAS